MKPITITDRLRYRFDLTMARGTTSLILWLFAVTALLVSASAAILIAADLLPKGEDGSSADSSFLSVVWQTLMRAMDAGTVAGDNGSRLYLAVMFITTLGGIFIVSILVGLITNGIQGRIENLRKGRSLVCEDDHTVILGWSSQIFAVVSELAIANKSRKSAAIAIIADKDKVEMEDELRAKCGPLYTTRVVCRTGSPIDPADIAIARPDAARSIIVLAPEGDAPDVHVLKTILALTNGPDRKKGKYHIVAEIRDRHNLEAAKLAGKDEAQLLCTEDILSRITVQTARQSGLSAVYNELLDFEGAEIYMAAEPALVGKTFGDALRAYEACSAIGVLTAAGEVRLKPPMDTVIKKGDQIIAIAEDDSAMALGAKPPRVEEDLLRNAEERRSRPERALFLGWNRRAPGMLLELDHYVAKGSTATVLAESPGAEAAVRACRERAKNLDITFIEGSTTDRPTLDELAPRFEHIITLSYSDELDAQKADARTLVTLLHLRDIESKRGETFSIVSEMLDVRNRQLAEAAKPDDFIVSDKLVSLLLTQISENARLAAVFDDLFDPEGAEVYLKPAGDYVALGKAVRYATVVEAAQRRGEVAIGYLSSAEGSSAPARVNPNKGEKLKLDEADKIIVLAES